MNIVHSLNTAPLQINCYNVKNKAEAFIWYFALSLAYLKKLDVKTVLYTDDYGKELLGFLPYDEIKDLKIDKSIHPRFWACSKFYAMLNEPLESIHIDGDVFLKSDKIIDAINNSDWDLLVLNFEKAEYYIKEWSVYFEDRDWVKNELDFDLLKIGAYNTGILGFRNLGLKDKFISNYFKGAKHFSEVSKSILDNDTHLTPDLILEQTHIYQLAKDYKVKELLQEPLQESAAELRYLHVCSSAKYFKLDRAKETLKHIDSEIYNLVINKILK